MFKKLFFIRIYKRSIEYKRIGNRAVKEVQLENKKLGIPNVYSRNGKLYYELPNGKITEKDPFLSLHYKSPVEDTLENTS